MGWHKLIIFEKDKEHAANLHLMADSNKVDISYSESVLDFSNHKVLEQSYDNLLNNSHILT